MNDGELRPGLCRCTAGQAKHPFRVSAQAKGADPFTVLQGPQVCGLSVRGRQDRAIGLVEYLCGSGPKQHAPESASVRRHDDEIESFRPCGLRNLFRRFTRAQDSGTSSWWKLRFQERVELLLGNAQMLFFDLLKRSHVEFESVVAVEIADVDQRYLGAEQVRGSFHVTGHGNAAR